MQPITQRKITRGNVEYNMEYLRHNKMTEKKIKAEDQKISDSLDPDFLTAREVMVFGSTANIICENLSLEAARNFVRRGRALVLSSEAITMVKRG